MKKVLFVVGPTSSGKTSLAQKLSSKHNGAVVNADSRQVYKNLNIISGKDIAPGTPFVKNHFVLKGIEFYLFDLVKPTESFSVSDYLNFAVPLVDSLEEKKILPVIVGGSGFYIKALIDGVGTIDVPPNEIKRKKLEKMSLQELQEKLKFVDLMRFNKLNTSDIKNKRRLIRAIEVAGFGNDLIQTKKLEGFDVKIIGLKAESNKIKQRIDKRIEDRIESGALEEAKNLFENFDKLSEQIKLSIGYREMFDFLSSKLSLEEAIEKWRISEYQLVKKQMTWFRKDKRIVWFDIEEQDFIEKVEEEVSNWYNIPAKH